MQKKLLPQNGFFILHRSETIALFPQHRENFAEHVLSKFHHSALFSAEQI